MVKTVDGGRVRLCAGTLATRGRAQGETVKYRSTKGETGMKYKYGMPEDVRELCCAHVRGYERRRRELQQKKRDAYQSIRPEEGVELLEAAGRSQDKQSVVAVEIAMIQALQGIKSREVRGYLRSGIILNICNRKKHPYERLHLPTVGKKEFYRRKNDFLVALAEALGYLEL